LTQFKWGLRLVHAATVPSNRLAEDWQGYTNTYILPNYIELERYIRKVQQPHSGVIIGWGGSLSHLQSFQDSGLVSALIRVCQARPNVKVMICGDRRVFDKLALPKTQSIFQPWVSPDDWPDVLANFDIGLAPLSGPYDERRSWIKVLEYMVMKIPWIASDNSAYHSLRSYGWLVQNNSAAWERVLLDMVDHIQAYKNDAAGDPYLFGIGQNIEENIENVLSTYATIANKALGSQPQFAL
jgi:glycosyltransferase involved in cell wall biosynthesis